MAKGPGTVLPDPDGIAERWGLAPLPPGEPLLDAYARADGPGELGPFADLLRLRRVADALYSPTSAARGEPWSPEYVGHLRRALDNLDE